MKILYVGSLPPSKDGISDHNYFLLKNLVNQDDHEVYILPDMKNDHPEILDIPSKHIISYGDLQRINFDAIHFQIGNSYPSSYVFNIFKQFKEKKIKKIVTLHDLTTTNIAKIIRTIGSQPSNLIYEFNKPTMQEIIENTDSVIVYSNFIKNQITNKYKNSKISILPMGAEDFQSAPKNILRENLGLNKKQFILSSFGFITPRKGYEEVIKAIDLLVKKNIDIKYYIIGNFNYFHYKWYLKYLVNKLNLRDRIIFPGYLSVEKSRDLLAASDIIIQPRKYSNEGASFSLTTALFSANPIITIKTGGLKEYIENEKTGILIDHTTASYAESINKLYADPSLRNKLGQNALNWAKKNILWESIAKNHLHLYTNI